MTASKANLADSGETALPDERERRQAPRVLVNLEVDYGHEDNFLFAYIRDISVTGIFVRTDSPEPPGTRLNLRFSPLEGQVLDVEGVVIWINPYRPGNSNSLHPGMGIRFEELGPEQLLRLTELVRTFAYLDDDSDENELGAEPVA